MTLDARGLRPTLEATAGLGTLAAVIGFVLACLAAATVVIGFHPGFVIHDSRGSRVERVGFVWERGKVRKP